MTLALTGLYGLFAWYCDKILPSEYGTTLPLYFPFMPSYWGVNNNTAATTTSSLENKFLSPLLDEAASVGVDMSKQEPVGEECKQQERDKKCVFVRNLRKVFKTTGMCIGIGIGIYMGVGAGIGIGIGTTTMYPYLIIPLLLEYTLTYCNLNTHL